MLVVQLGANLARLISSAHELRLTVDLWPEQHLTGHWVVVRGLMDLVHFHLLESLVDLSLLRKARVYTLLVLRITVVEILQSCVILRQALGAVRLFQTRPWHRTPVHRRDIEPDHLVRSARGQASSHRILHLGDGVLRHPRLFGDELRLEGAFPIDAFRVNMFLAH